MALAKHPLDNILAIVGPTAGGKSAFSLRLVEACKVAHLPIELISMDSALVYRGMNLGTAKPSPTELERVPHHGINIRDPWESYSAAIFAQDVQDWVTAIHARGHLPVIVGGTMLYWRALMQGLTNLPASTVQIRQQISQEAASLGWDSMYAKLQLIDPQTAARLPPGDLQRISRALEIYAMTGKTMSDYLHQQPYASSRNDSLFEHLLISLEPPDRSWLHTRIEQRWLSMLEQGLLDEVAELLKHPLITTELPAMRAVGYRQAITHLQQLTSFDEFVQTGLAASRQLAKRQLTWLRAMPSRKIVNPSDTNDLTQALAYCLAHLQKFK